MKPAHLFAHLSFPALVALVGFAVALQREPFGIGVLFSTLLGGYLFYAAPHLTWASICAVFKPSLFAWHAGFFLASCALVIVGIMSFFFHDPSGLPYQWLVYWPLAGILLLVVIVVWVFAGRPHAGA